MVDGGGCCPMMDLLRSEPMQLVQLIIPLESAHLTVSYLGELGLFQFKDVSIKQTHLIHMNMKCTHIPTSFIFFYLRFLSFVLDIKFVVCFIAEGWAGYEFEFTYFILIIPFDWIRYCHICHSWKGWAWYEILHTNVISWFRFIVLFSIQKNNRIRSPYSSGGATNSNEEIQKNEKFAHGLTIKRDPPIYIYIYIQKI